MSNDETVRMDGDEDPDKTQITPIDIGATMPSGPNSDAQDMDSKPSIGDTDVFDQQAANDDSFIGQTLGNYHILNQLGKGGFGTVYKARDVKLDRYVAVKFLTAPMETEYSKLFEREAKILANLSKNPNIVQIYTWGEHRGSNYMALEYMDYSLEDKIEENVDGLPLKEALEIIANCCDALTYAHDQGVLHRDIKPANVLVDAKTNQVKVCDFGLARFYNKGIDSATQTIAGSPPFMSIEQITGKSLDERSDVYSLGVTLYQLLSGNLPFSGNSQFEIMEKIRSNDSTPLPKQRDDLPRVVYDIVKKSMAHNADDRFQSAEEFGKALRKAIHAIERTGSADSIQLDTGKPAFPRWVTAALAVFLVGLSAFAIMRDPTTVPPGPLAHASVLVNSGQNSEAINLLQQYVAENPNNDKALHLLAHAEQLDGKIDEAASTAQMIADEAMKREVEAAVAFQRDGSQSRDTLEQLAANGNDGYVQVLLAQLDMNAQNHQAAVERLQNMDALQFYYDWQKYKAQQLLGQAYYNLQDLESAAGVFGQLREVNSNPAVSGLAEKYYKLAKREQDDAHMKAFQEQLDYARQTIQKDEEFDAWTSRPMRVKVSQPDISDELKTRLYAIGMQDVFIQNLRDALLSDDDIPIDVLDRQQTEAILQEQNLVASVGNGQSKLAQIMGVRVSIDPEFKSALGKEYLQLNATDYETTEFIRVPESKIDLPQDGDWDAFFEEVEQSLRSALGDKYVLQGILTKREGKTWLNIGANVGVKPGMTFALHRQPNTAVIDKAYMVKVTDEVGPKECVVEVDGFSAESIPEEGWYAKQKVGS